MPKGKSMSNKLRSKQKNSPVKRKQRTFSNVRLWSWESMLTQEGLTVSHGEVRLGHVWKQLSQEQVNEVGGTKRNWSICCRALCRIDDPEEIWVETSLRTIKDSKINTLEDMYAEMRKDVMAVLAEDRLLDTVVDCGWILRSFSKTDPIDGGYESDHLGPIHKNRYLLWQESQKEITDV